MLLCFLLYVWHISRLPHYTLFCQVQGISHVYKRTRMTTNMTTPNRLPCKLTNNKLRFNELEAKGKKRPPNHYHYHPIEQRPTPHGHVYRNILSSSRVCLLPALWRNVNLVKMCWRQSCNFLLHNSVNLVSVKIKNNRICCIKFAGVCL